MKEPQLVSKSSKHAKADRPKTNPKLLAIFSMFYVLDELKTTKISSRLFDWYYCAIGTSILITIALVLFYIVFFFYR